jgi:hypothetical protein
MARRWALFDDFFDLFKNLNPFTKIIFKWIGS